MAKAVISEPRSNKKMNFRATLSYLQSSPALTSRICCPKHLSKTPPLSSTLVIWTL